MTASKLPFGRIIKLMELWRIYRFTVFIKKYMKKDADYALASFCMVMFGGKKKKFFIKSFSNKEIKEIMNNAIERKFLEPYKKLNSNHLRITALGRDLTELKGLGFIVIAGKKYSVLLSILTGLAAIASVIISISK